MRGLGPRVRVLPQHAKARPGQEPGGVGSVLVCDRSKKCGQQVLCRAAYRRHRFPSGGRKSGYRGRVQGRSMNEPLPIRAMNAIELGIRTARQNPKSESDPTPDDYVAWCIWNELRRAGFKVVDVEGSSDESN